MFECVDVAARREKSLLEVLGPDDPQVLRLHWLAVPPHRRQQLGDAAAVHPLDAEELGERLVRAANLLQDFALDRSTRESAKLSDELAHGALAAEITISRHVGGKITLQSALVVPMRARGIARSPLLPIQVRGGAVDELPALPHSAQAQMRIE